MDLISELRGAMRDPNKSGRRTLRQRTFGKSIALAHLCNAIAGNLVGESRLLKQQTGR